MNRRKFIRTSGLLGFGAAMTTPVFGQTQNQLLTSLDKSFQKSAKNIIFLVSDGMSIGTLKMADILIQQREGRKSYWMQAYADNLVKRALMDTSSADSMVTDSAAAGSAWGGGSRVPNGKLNMDAEGNKFTPILQKFKKQHKAVGCVTTVPITHATPASFCVTQPHRSMQEEIAEDYLALRFDVMLGGGAKYFKKNTRKDGKDLLKSFKDAGFYVAEDKNNLNALKSENKPVLGVFDEEGLPYTIDQMADATLQKAIPTLAEMTKFAIDSMKDNANGFVLQVEAGKVDWAAHANDTAAILYDQVAFDDAVKVALDFAQQDQNTLVIITTDHGNANPGLFYGKNVAESFQRVIDAKQSNEWILKEVNRSSSIQQIVERVEHASNCKLSDGEALELMGFLKSVDPDQIYNPYRLPFADLAKLQQRYTQVGWAATNHSADFVELAMYGPGSEALVPFVNNYELHDFMLAVTGTK
ncbi:MAG: alkaline phosphatase [Crocinitomicaceae bacterium]|nr:alkaline phosphatase [Crocinitomicaceae bacterium]